MGSCSATCAVSKLAIPGGTPIRAVLLTENPYGEGWDLRAPPIRAEYNDYGNIENLRKEDAAIARLWLQALDVDLVECGVGDNQCHDVATRRGMSFEALCEAMQEGRVLVRQDAKTFWHPPPEDASLTIASRRVNEAWRPTMANVEAVLGTDHAMRLSVDQPIGNVVRVRQAGYGTDTAALTLAQTKLSGSFAVAMTAGSGNYGFGAELLVFAAPGKDRSFAGPAWENKDEERHLKVRWAFVREDVWDGFLAESNPSWIGPGTIDERIARVFETWHKVAEEPARRQKFGRDQPHFSVRPRARDLAFGPWGSQPGCALRYLGVVTAIAENELRAEGDRD